MIVAAIYRKTIAFSGMTFMGLLTSFIRFVSFGKFIELNRQIIAPICCRIILRLAGVKVNHNITRPKNSVLYFFNHNSFLDIFVIPLLGLKNTRFIISEATQKILPLHLCNLGIDVLYIPTKSDSKRRLAFFKRVTQDLKDNKYSVICAPEGQHDFKHWIAPFNKGVFHMATLSRKPIQNLFFEIPKKGNPLNSLNMSSCTVTVSIKDLILTEKWVEKNLALNIKATREMFKTYYQDYHGGLDDTIA